MESYVSTWIGITDKVKETDNSQDMSYRFSNEYEEYNNNDIDDFREAEFYEDLSDITK